MPEEKIRLTDRRGRPPKLTQKLLQQQYVRKPLNNFLGRVGAWFEGGWKQRVSVGVSGAYRASIQHEVDTYKSVTIYSPIHYAPYREYGTRPHWVPRQALQRWADLKGIPVRAVQWAIAKRGTKAENALGGAVTASRGPLRRMVDQLAKDIGIEWERD